ncbi:unnamed protein product [Rotaria sp. Silwood1]|nr:unnamed protein product [Rotaria sp. Silwood1]CAF1595481.1 unnamed protein product [Rotaria sp. Silwood1]
MLKSFQIKGVLTDPIELVKKIDIDQKKRQKLEDSIGCVSSFFNPDGQSTKNLQSENGDFIWLQLFIESLLRMSDAALLPSRNEFLEFLRQQYHDNNDRLRIIDDLKSSYQANQAIKWYTRASFLYDIMNKAFRQQDYVLLFTLRFFIHDLFYSLAERKRFEQSFITLYRGQALDVTELNNLIENQGNFITMNSFISTSRDRLVATGFAASSIDPNNVRYRSVLFEINVNTTRDDVKPFADVSQDSQFSDENEVLFMAGSIFRIVNVQKVSQDDPVWLIKLVLCGEEDYQLKEVFTSLKVELDDETDMGSVGKVLFDMGKGEQAEIAFEIDRQDTRIRTNGEFGYPLEAYIPGQYDSETMKEAQELAAKLIENNDDRRLLVFCYNIMGSIYRDHHQYDSALENFSKALDVLLNLYDQDHLEIAIFHEFIGQIYEKQEKMPSAIKSWTECLRIRQHLLPEAHPIIALTFRNIGDLYNNVDDFDNALVMYEKALKIQLLSSPSNHPSIAETYQCIGWVYEQTKEFRLALKNYTSAFKILQASCPPTDASLLQIQEDIDNMRRELNASSENRFH